MIEVKVTVELTGLPEAITRLAEAIAMMPRHDAVNACVKQDASAAEQPAVVSAEPKRRRMRERTTEEPKVTEEQKPMVETPVPVVNDEPTPAKEYTLDQISKAGLALMDAGRLNDLMGLLAKHGLQSLTAADPKQYAAIASDLIAMGGSIPEV